MESCTFYTLEPAQSRADEIHLLVLAQLLSSITAPGGGHGDQNRLALSAGVTGGDPPRESALSIHSNLHRLGLARHTLVHVQHLTSILPPTQLPALLLLALLNPPSSTLAAPSARSRVTFSWPAAFLRGLWSPIFLLRNDEGCGRTIRSAAPSVSSHHASCTTRSPEDLPDLSNIVSEEKKENLRD